MVSIGNLQTDRQTEGQTDIAKLLYVKQNIYIFFSYLYFECYQKDFKTFPVSQGFQKLCLDLK